MTVEVDRLMHLPLFGELDQHDLSQLAHWLRDVHLRPDEVMIEQGELPYEIFWLEEGSVAVERDGERLATLGPGEVVGEIGLIEQERRMATVRAVTEVHAVALHADDLDKMREEMPEIAAQLHEIATRRRSGN
jgi:CRP/FNR family transcriptional regulator, cyclic AMP receptor protein